MGKTAPVKVNVRIKEGLTGGGAVLCRRWEGAERHQTGRERKSDYRYRVQAQEAA